MHTTINRYYDLHMFTNNFMKSLTSDLHSTKLYTLLEKVVPPEFQEPPGNADYENPNVEYGRLVPDIEYITLEHMLINDSYIRSKFKVTKAKIDMSHVIDSYGN